MLFKDGIFKSKRGVRRHNTRENTEIIKETMGIKVSRKKLCEDQKELSELIDNKTGHTTTNKQDVLHILRVFFAGIPNVQNQASKDIPDSTQEEINNCAEDMKNKSHRR